MADPYRRPEPTLTPQEIGRTIPELSDDDGNKRVFTDATEEERKFWDAAFFSASEGDNMTSSHCARFANNALNHRRKAFAGK